MVHNIIFFSDVTFCEPSFTRSSKYYYLLCNTVSLIIKIIDYIVAYTFLSVILEANTRDATIKHAYQQTNVTESEGTEPQVSQALSFKTNDTTVTCLVVRKK
jgi:hypothetical protein